MRVTRRMGAAMALALAVSLGMPAIAAAQGGEGLVPAACRLQALRTTPQGCTICHMGELVINLTNFAMKTLAFPLAVLLVAIGGLMLLVSGASEERRSMGKKILTSAVIGLIIVILAWIGVDTIIKVLNGNFDLTQPAELSRQFGPWNRFDASRCNL